MKYVSILLLLLLLYSIGVPGTSFNTHLVQGGRETHNEPKK